MKKFSVALSIAGLGLVSSLALATPAPQQEPGVDPSAMDLTVDPCQDFYKFSCGNWESNFTLPAGYSRYGRRFNGVDDRAKDLLITILKGYAAGQTQPDVPFHQQMGDLFTACLNAPTNKSSGTDLANELTILNSLKAKSDLTPIVIALYKKGVSAFFSFSSGADFMDPTQSIGQLGEGGTSLPSEKFYVDASAEGQQILAAYKTHITNLFKLSGESDKDAATHAASAYAVELALGKLELDPATTRDPLKVYTPMPASDVASRYSSLDWNAFWTGLGIASTQKVNLSEPTYFAGVDHLIATTRLDDLHSYLKWRILDSLAGLLDQPFIDEQFAFNGKILSGESQPLPQDQTCKEVVDGALGFALGQAYVEQAFSEQSRAAAKTLIGTIKDSLKRDLGNLSWLDDATRNKALTKLSLVTDKVGYPDKIIDYSPIVVNSQSFVESGLSAVEFRVQRDLNKIGKTIDRTEWDMTPQEVNAYYDPSSNQINFPAAILQPSFYSVAAPLAWNYGGIGAVMGHELTHGFDDQGRLFDGFGKLSNWWSDTVAADFKTRTECLVNQYSGYVVGNVHLDGSNTLGENLADLGGIKLSYAAYQKATAGQTPPPNVGNLNQDQQFFVAYAQNWCTKSTLEQQETQAKSNVHSVERFRVNGVVPNVPAFAQAFGCQAGTPMAPKDRCEIW